MRGLIVFVIVIGAGLGWIVHQAHVQRDAVEAIKKAGGPNLDKRTVQLPKAHIKSVGSHPIAVRLHPDVDASVSLSVVAV